MKMCSVTQIFKEKVKDRTIFGFERSFIGKFILLGIRKLSIILSTTLVHLFFLSEQANSSVSKLTTVSSKKRMSKFSLMSFIGELSLVIYISLIGLFIGYSNGSFLVIVDEGTQNITKVF